MTRRTARKKKALPDLGPAPRSRNGLWVAILLAALVLVNLYVFVWNKETSLAAVRDKAKGGPAMVVPGAGALDGAGDAGPRGVFSGLLSRSLSERAQLTSPNVVEGTVSNGDSLGRLLKRNGLTAQQTDEIIRALHGVVDFKSIRAGQRFRLQRDELGEVQTFELVISKISTVRAQRDGAGQLQGAEERAQTRVEVKQLGGHIDSSLYASIKAAGEDSSLVAFFVDVFAYDLDFYNDTHEGDVFRVVVEKEYKDQEFLRYRRILAAEYQGKTGRFRTFQFTPSGASGEDPARYYDEAGESAEKTFLKTPLKFARMSSGFDRRRMHPVLHTVRAHLGVDYAAPVGTPVWAAAPGKIISRGPAGGAGNMVVLRHDNGLDTVYMHLSKFAAGQKVGQQIEAKTVIGFVGTTGLSTGPHLHFGVKKGGAFVDPTSVAPLRRASLAKQHREAFLHERDRLQRLLDAALVDPDASAEATADATRDVAHPLRAL